MTTRERITPQRFGHLPAVRDALEMQREISRATTEDEVLVPFIQRISSLSEVSHALSLLTDGLDDGAYRTMCCFDLDDPVSTEWLKATSRWKLPPEQTPAVRTPMVSAMIATGEPCLLRGVSAADDESLAGMYEGELDLLAIPIFKDGRVCEFVVLVGRFEEDVDEVRLHMAVDNFNLMVQALKHIRTSNELGSMHGKLDAQIAEIGRVQRSLLPSSWPTDPRLGVATSYETSEAAGGDYFDYRAFPNPNGSGSLLGVVIADVSGHGPVAAVTMAIFRTAIHATALYTQVPKSTVPDMNTMLYESVEPGTFVTAHFIALDPATGQATSLSCGHNPPRIRRKSGEIEPIDNAGGPPLGILPKIAVPEVVFDLHPGDTLVLYTDGITEAFSPYHELFGTERLDTAIAAGGGDPELTKRSILDAVAAHAEGRPRDDDQTLVVIRYNGPDAASRT